MQLSQRALVGSDEERWQEQGSPGMGSPGGGAASSQLYLSQNSTCLQGLPIAFGITSSWLISLLSCIPLLRALPRLSGGLKGSLDKEVNERGTKMDNGVGGVCVSSGNASSDLSSQNPGMWGGI